MKFLTPYFHFDQSFMCNPYSLILIPKYTFIS